MTFLIIIGVFWFIGYLIESWKNPPAPPRNNQRTQTTYQPRQPRDTHRPTGRAGGNMTWKNVNGVDAANLKEKDIEGLQDAYSGESLSLLKGVIQCNSCKVFYHKSSLEVLKAENSGACVSCGSVLADTKYTGSTTADGVNYNPNIVSLRDVRSYVGRVVTFEGRVVKIVQSRRRIDYAVLFEDGTWSNSFKLVFFGSSLSACGGESFVTTLRNKNIKVRGLVVKHRKYGYEIIISERSMILGVS